MKYHNPIEAVFLSRKNRFCAYARMENGNEEPVHVKNSGRLAELLLPQSSILLEKAANPNRKTKYDLIAVSSETAGWINVDSQACNALMEEWLSAHFERTGWMIRREKTYGHSRFDFCLEKEQENKPADKVWLEVKGCTLNQNGKGCFPDAPTSRGTRHLEHLSEMARQRQQCILCFVMPRNDLKAVQANEQNDPDFARALFQAKKAGVRIWHAQCRSDKEGIEVSAVYEEIPMKILKEVKRPSAIMELKSKE